MSSIDARRDQVHVSFDSPTDQVPPTSTIARPTRAVPLRPRPGCCRASSRRWAVSYKAADGLTIHGYLTRPVGVPTRNLPLVVVVHADHGRAIRGDMTLRRSSSRIVVRRASAQLSRLTGYGKAFYNAAVKEVGWKMHTDLIDGVRWAITGRHRRRATRGDLRRIVRRLRALVGLTFTPGCSRVASTTSAVVAGDAHRVLPGY